MDKKTKSIIASVFAAVLFAFTIVGKIITNSHLDNTREQAQNYNADLKTLSSLIKEANTLSSSNRVEYIKNSERSAKLAIEDIRKVLDYFEKLRVPSKLSAEYRDIKAAIERERGFMNAIEQMFEARSDEEFRAAALAAANTNSEADDGFAMSLSRFIKKMENCVDTRRERRKFLWL